MRMISGLGVVVCLAAGVGCAQTPCPTNYVKTGSRCEATAADASAIADEGTSDAGGRDDDEPAGNVAPDAGPPGAIIDEIAQECLVDRDGDHFGGPGSATECARAGAQGNLQPGDCNDGDQTSNPEAPEACGDGRDNDCDSALDEGVSELCNGIDDDCDGQVENGFACARGARQVACVTSCGSQGTGTCSDSCTLPVDAACAPPTETCNWRDDDCDGVVDQDLLGRAAQSVFARSPEAGQTPSALTKLARGRGDNSWLLYKVGTGSDGSAVRARAINAKGVPGSEMSQPLAQGAKTFRVASDGEYVVLLIHSRRNSAGIQLANAGHSLVLQVRRADDLKLLASTDIAIAADEDLNPGTLDEDDCNRLWASDVAAFEDNSGKLQIGVTFGHEIGHANTAAGGPGFCEVKEGGLYLINLELRNGSLSMGQVVSLYPTPVGTVQFGPSSEGALEPVPCRSEWLLAHAQTGEHGVLERRKLGGGLLEEVGTYPALPGAYGLSMGEVDCRADHSEFLLRRTHTTQPYQTELVRFEVSHASGISRALGDAITLTTVITDAIQSGGRWLSVGFEPSFSGQPIRVEELSLENWGLTRSIDAYALTGQDANPGRFPAVVVVLEPALINILATPRAVLVSAPNSFSKLDSNLDSWREPGETASAAGVVYRFDCL
ncbi:MAG: putative metal-binding motif-containing protein [Myxococcales bacterium]